MNDYLNNIHLLSSKYLDFKQPAPFCAVAWRRERANYLYHNKFHKETVYYDEIKLLKNSMNTKRTEFNWSHLEQYKD